MSDQGNDSRHRTSSASAAMGESWVLIVMATGMAALALTVSMFLGYRMGTENAAQTDRAALAVVSPADQLPPPDAVVADTPLEPEDEVAGAPVAKNVAPKAAAVSTRQGDLPPITPPTNRGMLHVPPVQVQIPAIGVESKLVKLGLAADNSLQVPEDYSKAGWYTGGAYPGDVEGPPAVIVGHVDDENGPAVFYALNQLTVGDEVRVRRSDGSIAVFVVYDYQQYPKTALPTEEVYRNRKESELVLITCTGDFDVNASSYLDNYVVTARLDPMLTKAARG